MKHSSTLWSMARLVPMPWLTALLALMVLTSFSEGVGVLLLIPLLESIQDPELSYSWLGQGGQWLSQLGLGHNTVLFMAGLLLLITLKAALQYVRDDLSLRWQLKLVDRLRTQVFQALLRVEWHWWLEQRRSDHATTLLTDINRVGVGFNFFLSLLSSLVTLCVYLVIALGLSWPVTLLALGSVSILFAMLSGQRRRAVGLGQELSQANQAMQATVQESLSGIKLAKILRRETHFLQQFKQAMRALRQKQIDFQHDTNLARALFQVGGAFLLMGYLWAGLSVWHLQLPYLLTLVLVFSRMIPLCMSAQQQFHRCLHASPALARAKQQLADYQRFAEPEASSSPITFVHSLSLEQVSYHYPHTTVPALQALSVTIPARTTTAVIGRSGSGKSTLADLLMGLLVPDHGEIRIDGQPLFGTSRLAWRRHVAYVPQDVFLFHDTIRANLLLARPDADDAQLHEALKQAAAEFVFTLPKALDTLIGDNGIRLSGGERQRLALARALLQRPALLILDEATSALDVQNELAIRRAIEQLHGELTVVLIGHRLATLEHADQVLQLEQGQVIGCGRWQDIKTQAVVG